MTDLPALLVDLIGWERFDKLCHLIAKVTQNVYFWVYGITVENFMR